MSIVCRRNSTCGCHDPTSIACGDWDKAQRACGKLAADFLPEKVG